jgi:hypothetical protein
VTAVLGVVEHNESGRGLDCRRHGFLSSTSPGKVVENEIECAARQIWPQGEIAAAKVVRGYELFCTSEPYRVVVDRGDGAFTLFRPEAQDIGTEP